MVIRAQLAVGMWPEAPCAEYCGTDRDPFLVNVSANSAEVSGPYQTDRSCISLRMQDTLNA